MGIQLYTVILVLFVRSLHLDQHYSDTKEALQATKGICPVLVALHSQRTLPTRSASIAHHCQDSELTSFKGPSLHCPHPTQDDGANKDTLALQVLPAPKQDECSSLWTMRHTMASLHRRVLRAWSQEDRDRYGHLELCRMDSRRIAMGLYTAETQIAEKDQKDTNTSKKSREREASINGAGIRPTMGCQSSCRSYNGNVIWIRPSDSATVAVSGQQAPKQRSIPVSAGDSAHHRRDHRHQDHLQEHASSSQESGPCTRKVQGGKGGTPQAPQFLDCLRGGECQEVENVCRRLHQERHHNGGGAQQSSRGPSRSKASSRCHKGATLETRCRGARGNRDHFRWRGRGREHESRHSSDDPEEDTLSSGKFGADPNTQHRRHCRPQRRGSIQKTAIGRFCRTWITCTVAFPRAGQVDLSEACPRPNDSLCFQYMMVDIWNHSIVTEDVFVNPWQASIAAIDLAQDVGTLQSSPTTLTLPCHKRHFAGQVRFSNHVDLYIGHEYDMEMAQWPHALGVPHQVARALGQAAPLPPDRIGTMEEDEVSLLSAHVAQREAPVHAQHQDQPPDAIIDDRNIARDAEELSPASSSDESDEESEELQMPEDWYSTLIYTIEGGPTPVWLDWNDYYGMHQRAAQALQVRFDDLYVMHWIQTPPQDTARANSASIIAHRRGDLPTGSLDRFVLLDVEFHSARPLEGPEVVRKARLIPDQLSRSQILRALGLHPVCQRASNRCLVWVNDELIPFGAPRIYVNDGDYMRIAVPPGSPQVDHIATRCLATAFHQGMAIEEISMRHTLYRLGWHDDLVGPPHVPRQRGFHELADGDEALYLQLYATALPPLEQKPMFLNDEDYFVPCAGAPGARIEEELPHQQEQQPSIVPVADPLQALQMQPAVIQELHMHWLAHMAQFEATNRPVNPTLHIQTWFLAMPAHLHCSEPRSVQLHQHFETWFRSIAEAWLDLLDPHWHVHIHLVRPMPPSTLLERDQRVHVIVVQRPPEDGVANLFSVIATHHVLEPMRHFARFAPLQVGKPQVIGFAGLSQDCYPERSPLQCMVWHGDLELRDQLALRNRNGVSFLIIIQDLPYLQPTQTTTAWDEDDDQLYFLQLSSRTEKRRCLTVGQVAHTQRPSSQPDVVALRLEEAIPCPPKVKVDFTPVQRILDAINSSTNEFVQDWPTGLETPQVTQEAIAELVPLSTEVPIAFHLYTDGSKTPEGAVGAGIVLLIEYQHGFALGGALGKVVLQDGHAGMGENGAVIWALLWALQLSNHTWASYGNIDIHYYFHFDAVNAGYLASGYFRTRKFPNHRILMRSLAHLIHGRHGLSRMHWRHIKAHAGIPWNEFADAIAKFASLHPDQVQDSKLWQTWLQDAEQLRAVQWAWYLEQMQAQSPHVPRFKDGFLECDITQVPVPNIPSQPQSDDHEPEPLKITVDVTIATANVLTLHQSMNHNQGTSISRQSVLMQQFHDAKCIFVGIQETRHRHTSLGYATLGIMYLGIPRHLRDKTECSFGSRTATLYVTKGLALRKNTFELCNPAQICS